MGVSSTGVSDIGYDVTGGGYLHLPLPENSYTVHCDQYHYGPVSGGGAEAGVEGGQVLVGSIRLELGGDTGNGSGGGTDGGGGGGVDGTETETY